MIVRDDPPTRELTLARIDELTEQIKFERKLKPRWGRILPRLLSERKRLRKKLKTMI